MSEPRCDRHVGETYPPRCYECEALATQTPDPSITRREGLYAEWAELGLAGCELDSAAYLPDGAVRRLNLEPGKYGSFFIHFPQANNTRMTLLTKDIAWFDMFVETPLDVIEGMAFPWLEKCSMLYSGWPGDADFAPV